MVRKGLGGDLESYINWFGQLRGEVSVSETVGDNLFLAGRYPVCLVVRAPPPSCSTATSGARSTAGPADGSSRPARIGPSERKEGFLVPINSKVVGVITNHKTHLAQAEELKRQGRLEFAYGNPAAFSKGPETWIPQALKELAADWPGFGPQFGDDEPTPAAVWKITALRETSAKRGFLPMELVSWIQDHDGRIPSGAHPYKDIWNPGLWDKRAGILVVFPDHPGKPPATTSVLDPKTSIETQEPLRNHVRMEPLHWRTMPTLMGPVSPATLGLEIRGLPRLRRLVIQKGHPFAILDDGRIQTTKDGLVELKRLLASPPLPFSRWEKKPLS